MWRGEAEPLGRHWKAAGGFIFRKQKSRSERSSVFFKATGGFLVKLHSSYFATSCPSLTPLHPPTSTWNPPLPPSAAPSPHSCTPCQTIRAIVLLLFRLLLIILLCFFILSCRALLLEVTVAHLSNQQPPSVFLLCPPS